MTDTGAPAIAGILFDKDGTLLRYDETWAPVNREAARIAAAGKDELVPALLAAGGMDHLTGETCPDSLLAAGNALEIAAGFVSAGSPRDVRELAQELDALFVRAAEYSVAVTDLKALFGSLKSRGLKIGIASSDNEEAIRRTAAHHGITGYVDFLCGYDSGFGAKPQPGMFSAFCQSVGLEPRQVAMVGDNGHDMLMGRNGGAGLSIAVLSGTGTEETLSELADRCITDITALEALLFGSSKAGPADALQGEPRHGF